MIASPLPQAAAERKAVPLVSGVLDYFPAALAAVAECSKAGNDQHNPGQPLHWDRTKSGDEADALARHLFDRGTIDTDGIRHSAKVAWRALAMLQKELEDAGAPVARGAVATCPNGNNEQKPPTAPAAFNVAEFRPAASGATSVTSVWSPLPGFPGLRINQENGKIICWPPPWQYDPVAAEWQDSLGQLANPIKQTDEE